MNYWLTDMGFSVSDIRSSFYDRENGTSAIDTVCPAGPVKDYKTGAQPD